MAHESPMGTLTITRECYQEISQNLWSDGVVWEAETLGSLGSLEEGDSPNYMQSHFQGTHLFKDENGNKAGWVCYLERCWDIGLCCALSLAARSHHVPRHSP